MNAAARFLFDENTGAPFVEALKGVVVLDRRHPVEIAHTISLFGRGARDAAWIPQVVAEEWIVISEDRGMNSRAGDKLPVLCLQYRVTHVLVMPSILKHGGQFEKMRAVIAVWPKLLELAGAPRGTRVKLKYASAERSGFRLEPVEPRAGGEPSATESKPLGDSPPEAAPDAG